MVGYFPRMHLRKDDVSHVYFDCLFHFHNIIHVMKVRQIVSMCFLTVDDVWCVCVFVCRLLTCLIVSFSFNAACGP